MPTTDELKMLFSEFPKEDIHWRAQSLTRDGDKAMALAYLDARDVMDRLDQVCGAADWQDRYEFHGPRTVCYLSIRVDGEWIAKADAAGDTQVESEKGSVSDALKRAAVKWGIGRYLYDLPAPWVPCESYERGGKHHWKGWKEDPWKFVKGNGPSKAGARPIYAQLEQQMRQQASKADLRKWVASAATKALRAQLPADWDANLKQAAADFGRNLPDAEDDTVSDIKNQFPSARVTGDRPVSTLEAG